MKSMRREIIIGLIMLALCQLSFAQNKADAEGVRMDNVLPYQKDFLNLPAEKRQAFANHQQEASRLFNEKRIIEALESLKLAEKAFGDMPELWNLRGSCYVELRAFDKALESFRKASEIAGENPSILFNMGEVYFVTQRWQDAHDAFASLLKKIPEESVGLSRITEFKVMLCKLKLGQENEARILANKYDFLDDSPYHYYAKASLAYYEDDLQTAEQEIARAARIFGNAQIIAPWQDTLVEIGYIKSFYGGEDQ